MSTQQSARKGYRERQKTKRMPRLPDEPSGDPEEMNAIGEAISGHQPEIGDKNEGRVNRRSKRRRNQRSPTP